jgi:hypothetical protein
MILISKLKDNPDNPRFIKDSRFEKLCKSIKEFPKMMELKPIVIDENNMILAGNMRKRALLFLGYKEIPESWVKKSTELNEEEKRRFIIADNISFGENDYDLLANNFDAAELISFGLDLPISLEDIEKLNLKDADFEKEFNGIKDSDCEYPIVVNFMEKHECFIIPVSNEIDENFIRNVFGLNINFKSRDKKIRKSNVISIENVRANFHSNSN